VVSPKTSSTRRILPTGCKTNRTAEAFLGTWTLTATQYHLRMAGKARALGYDFGLARVSSRLHRRLKPVQVALDQFAILVADAGHIAQLRKTGR
jgi:hypothetical protein